MPRCKKCIFKVRTDVLWPRLHVSNLVIKRDIIYTNFMLHLQPGHQPKPAMLIRTDTNVEVSKKIKKTYIQTNKQNILSK